MSGLQAAPVPAEEVARAIEEVLARAEFAPERAHPLERLVQRLLESLDLGLPAGSGGVLLWVLALLACALLGVLVVRAWPASRRRRARRAEAVESQELAQRVAELRERARAARARGELALALRLGFFALVLGLSQRGELRYHEAWTNRELLERGAPGAAVAGQLAPLVEALDRKTFGREPAEEADVERLEELCRRLLDRGRAWRAGGAA